MQGYTIEGILGSGLDLAPLLLIPAIAVVCAVVLLVGVLRGRIGTVLVSVLLAVAASVIAISSREAVIAPAAVDLLVMQIPAAMLLAGLTAAARLMVLRARSHGAVPITVDDLARPTIPAFDLSLLIPATRSMPVPRSILEPGASTVSTLHEAA